MIGGASADRPAALYVISRVIGAVQYSASPADNGPRVASSVKRSLGEQSYCQQQCNSSSVHAFVLALRKALTIIVFTEQR